MSIERRERKKGTVWRVVWYEGSARRTKSFDRKTDAQTFEAKVKLLKRQDGLEELDAGKETLDSFVDEWWARYGTLFLARNTQEQYRDLLKRFVLPTLGSTPLRKLTPTSVGGLRDMVLRESGAETARKTLAVLQGILERAVEWERIKVNPAKVVKKPAREKKGRAQPMAPRTVEELRRNLSNRDGCLVAVLAYAGLRPGEALALTWEDVGEQTLNVDKAIALGEEKGTKTGRTRVVRLLAPLARDLAEWRLASGNREGLVFPRPDGQPWKDTDWRNWRRRVWKEVAPKGTRPYDLRHSFASLLFQEGRNPAEIAEQLGHTLQTLLSTYTHVIEELRGAERKDAEDLVRLARQEQPIQEAIHGA